MRNLQAGNLFRSLKNLQVAESPAVPHVKRFARNAINLLQRSYVRIGNVQHVNIIPDATSVGSWIVVPKNLQHRIDAHVRVRVDEAGRDELAGAVDDDGPRGRRQLARSLFLPRFEEPQHFT